MKPVVYIDMLFLFNLLMDSITLYASSIILNKRLSVLRLLLTAVFLSLYSCAIFFPSISFFYSLSGKITVLLISTVIAFPSKNWKSLLKNITVFFSVSAILGGIIFALIFATDFGTSLGAAVSNGEVYLNIKASTLVFSLIISYLCIGAISYIKRQNAIKNISVVPIEIHLLSSSIQIFGFGDTGCNLCDPLTGHSAIIISPLAAKQLLAPKAFEALEKGKLLLPDEYALRYRALPFCTIANENGFLHGFVSDKVLINNNETKKCVIAIAQNSLTYNADYDAIFNPSILDVDSNLKINFQ